ncbi:MAG: 4-hydroxythreonine-4-phosphate dehydrogenase PdxA [Ignavibacteria bacterium]|nr:4-hydroxythreonine-4-phosphate dehydrogenase PdxA [Ignavibacteria bacterium]
MKPRLLVTIGDFNGIGPEIILKTLNNRAFLSKYDITVISPFSVLAFYSKLLKIRLDIDNFNVIPTGDENVIVIPGKISAVSGYVSGLAIQTAIDLCLNGEYDAIVTAPIAKIALNLGGFNYDGHTEMLTDLGKAKETCMVMLSDKLNMGFATTHPPISKVAGMITKSLVKRKIGVCVESLKNDLKISKPSIGVLGLNPHAGDSGLIGSEEIKIITPALREIFSKNKNVKLSGPFSPDAYFASKAYNRFDMTFAMYHDQGFIPFKMLAGHLGTNFTAGLKFVRTSPDHGTAFDIAGRGIASEVSLVEAIKWADKIVKNRISKN